MTEFEPYDESKRWLFCYHTRTRGFMPESLELMFEALGDSFEQINTQTYILNSFQHIGHIRMHLVNLFGVAGTFTMVEIGQRDPIVHSF